MQPDRSLPTSWPAMVDAIVRGDRPNIAYAVLGRTPDLLVTLGLEPAKLVMACGKIARARREHPEVPLDVWRKLPVMLADPLAAFPSEHEDGSLIVVLIVADTEGKPIVVPIAPGANGARNIVLTVYGKETGFTWVHTQVAHHARRGGPLFRSKGFAATLPQPGFTEAIPSSSDPIPVDGTTKPTRQILSLRRIVKD